FYGLDRELSCRRFRSSLPHSARRCPIDDGNCRRVLPRRAPESAGLGRHSCARRRRAAAVSARWARDHALRLPPGRLRPAHRVHHMRLCVDGWHRRTRVEESSLLCCLVVGRQLHYISVIWTLEELERAEGGRASLLVTWAAR